MMMSGIHPTCTKLGLPQTHVAMRTRALLPHDFTLTPDVISGRYIFCCAILEPRGPLISWDIQRPHERFTLWCLDFPPRIEYKVTASIT